MPRNTSVLTPFVGLWPTKMRYSQTSVDGCLSIWDIYRSKNGNSLSGQCLIATPNSIVDQTALVTDMSWSPSDNLLAVGSDDGKVTFVLLESVEEEVDGMLRENNETWPLTMFAGQAHFGFRSQFAKQDFLNFQELHVEDIEDSVIENYSEKHPEDSASPDEHEGASKGLQMSPLILLTPERKSS